MHQAVHKSSFIVSGGRMYYHAFGLIDQNHILILIEDIKGHLLRRNLRFHSFRHLESNRIAGRCFVAAFYRFSIHLHQL